MFIESFDKHYYDEEDIDAGKPITCQVVVNHTIVLTEEEKAQARQKAIQKAQDEAYAKMKQGKSKPKAKNPKPTYPIYLISEAMKPQNKFQQQVVEAKQDFAQTH